jgi:hypothetical protein
MEYIIARIRGWPAAIRWLLWIPASWLTSVLIHMAVALFGKFTIFFTRSAFGDNFFILLAAPAVSGFCAIRFPMTFVPAQRRGTALTLCIVWMVLLGVRAGEMAFADDFRSAFASLVMAIGCAVGYFNYIEHLERNRVEDPKLAEALALPAPRDEARPTTRDVLSRD